MLKTIKIFFLALFCMNSFPKEASFFKDLYRSSLETAESNPSLCFTNTLILGSLGYLGYIAQRRYKEGKPVATLREILTVAGLTPSAYVFLSNFANNFDWYSHFSLSLHERIYNSCKRVYAHSWGKDASDGEALVFDIFMLTAGTNILLESKNIYKKINTIFRTHKNFSTLAGDIPTELNQLLFMLKSSKNEQEKRFSWWKKNILIYGSHGAGKTALIEALEGEIKKTNVSAAFYSCSAKSLLEQSVGEATKTISNLYSKAYSALWSEDYAIVCIDDIDAFAATKDDSSISKLQKECLNTFLQELKTFEVSNIITIVCSSNKDTLDEAILSKDKFHTQIEISLPDFKKQCDIAHYYLKNLHHSLSDSALESLISLRKNLSCADIENCIKKAHSIALLKKEKITKNCRNKKYRSETKN